MLDLLLHGVGFYGPGAAIGPVRWPHHDLIVVMEGTLGLSINGSSVECVGGDAYLIPPGYLFQGVAGCNGTTIWVQHFSCKKRKFPEWISLPRTPVRWPGVAQWEWPRTLMRKLSRLQSSPALATSDRAGGLLLSLLVEEFKTGRLSTSGKAEGAEKTIQLVVDWIENHALPLPPLKEIAKFSGWSLSYFRDQFRFVSGRTLGEFLKQRRMGEAAKLLIETRTPIKEIALQAGYGDVAAFHRAFFGRYKVTPRHYREQRVLMV